MKKFSPVPYFMAAVIAHKRGSSVPQPGKLGAKAGREGIFRRKLRVCQMVEVKGRNTVEFTGVFFCRLQTFPLLGYNMQKDRCKLFVQVDKQTSQFQHIVTIYRADVLEAHLLKHGGVIDPAPDQLLAPLQSSHYPRRR